MGRGAPRRSKQKPPDAGGLFQDINEIGPAPAPARAAIVRDSAADGARGPAA
jgi:hypothetical protein